MKTAVGILSLCVFTLLVSSLGQGQTPATSASASATVTVPVTVPVTATPTPTPTPASEFHACTGGWADWKDDLQRVETDLENWASTHSEELKGTDVGDKREGRMIRLFAAYLLPPESPFALLHKVCWVQYSEFEKAIGSKNKAEANESMSGWENCARENNPQLPKEAEDLIACWKKNTLK